MVRGRSQTCERIRGAISAELDGELSELESVRVREHVAVCESCRDFRADAGTVAAILRAAPLEPIERPVAVPSRYRRALGFRTPAAAAAAAVLMIAFGGLFESLHGGAAIRGSNYSGTGFDNRADIRQMMQRQLQANYQGLLVRRAQFQSNRPVRHPGPQAS